MFSVCYFSTVLLGIAIILNEILLYSELMKLMKRWKSYEDENPGNNHMFINTFTFQKHWEVQYYLYAWFVSSYVVWSFTKLKDFLILVN